MGLEELAAGMVVVDEAHQAVKGWEQPEDSPLRKQVSKLAADEAVRFLQSISYPDGLLPQIHHAIEAHSFSANIHTETLEARIVQVIK